MRKLLVPLLLVAMLFLFAAGVNFWISSSLTGSAKVIVSLMVVADGVLYGILILLRNNRYRIIRVGWIAVVTVNILLTVFDNVGIPDVIFIILNVAVLLIYARDRVTSC